MSLGLLVAKGSKGLYTKRGAYGETEKHKVKRRPEERN